VRRFLLETSVLSRLNAALCSAVTDESDGQAMLEYLERANLFLVPLDQVGVWYRYHHLFADLLQARLRAEQPTTTKTLRLRAAHWHVQNGLPEEAVSYALTAEAYDLAAELIIGPAAGVAQRGEVTTLLHWYAAFPPHFVARHPKLSVQVGLAFALNGRWDEAETLLQAVEHELAGNAGAAPSQEALLLAYLVATYRQDTGRLAAIVSAANASEHLDQTVKLILALITSLSGDLRAACQMLAEVQVAAEQMGNATLAHTALFHQCRFEVFQGNLRAAHALSQQALEVAHDKSGASLPMVILAHASLSRVYIEWNKLDRAEQQLQQMLRLSELSGFVTGTLSSGTIMLAEVKQARGEGEAALQTAKQALAYAERYDPAAEVHWLAAYQARLWLAQGNVAPAADWLRASRQRHLPASLFYLGHIEPLTQARILLAQRKPADAITILTRLMTGPQDLLTVETLAVLALARQAHGDSVNAWLALEQALTLAEAENRLRVVLDLGAPMAQLLAHFLETQPGHSYAARLLAVYPSPPDKAPLIEPLREREIEVLRLIVAGYSNDEIAHTLVLTVSTVKWYINTIYAKLQVKTRSQAIARAHDLHLLD
jgi:LuxR family maltose regulon positive regulatory protein